MKVSLESPDGWDCSSPALLRTESPKLLPSSGLDSYVLNKVQLIYQFSKELRVQRFIKICLRLVLINSAIKSPLKTWIMVCFMEQSTQESWKLIRSTIFVMLMGFR